MFEVFSFDVLKLSPVLSSSLFSYSQKVIPIYFAQVILASTHGVLSSRRLARHRFFRESLFKIIRIILFAFPRSTVVKLLQTNGCDCVEYVLLS